MQILTIRPLLKYGKKQIDREWNQFNYYICHDEDIVHHTLPRRILLSII